jgi:hypothetical protein
MRIYSMKNILITALTTLAIFAATTFNACKPDKCKQISCAYSGTCKEGVCVCEVGYEGEHCETLTCNKFKGIYDVNEDGTISNVANYSISIESGAKINEVIIKNFQNNFTENVIAVCYKDTMRINKQTFLDGKTIEGWATIQDSNPLNQHYYQNAILTVYYTVKDPTLGFTNEYGTGGAGPSIWTK